MRGCKWEVLSKHYIDKGEKMRDIKDVVAWLEEELAHFEMAVEQLNYVSKADEIRYRMAQELLAWTLGYKYNDKCSVSRVPCEMEQDTKAFGGRQDELDKLCQYDVYMIMKNINMNDYDWLSYIREYGFKGYTNYTDQELIMEWEDSEDGYNSMIADELSNLMR
jgi:hypothetical protein